MDYSDVEVEKPFFILHKDPKKQDITIWRLAQCNGYTLLQIFFHGENIWRNPPTDTTLNSDAVRAIERHGVAYLANPNEYIEGYKKCAWNEGEKYRHDYAKKFFDTLKESKNINTSDEHIKQVSPTIQDENVVSVSGSSDTLKQQVIAYFESDGWEYRPDHKCGEMLVNGRPFESDSQYMMSYTQAEQLYLRAQRDMKRAEIDMLGICRGIMINSPDPSASFWREENRLEEELNKLEDNE